MPRIVIAGAGVLGRLLAWRLAHAGHEVKVFDPAPGPAAPPTGRGPAEIAAGFTAAGMLSPLAELDNAGPELAALGWRSLVLWHDVAHQLKPEGNGYVRRNGSLMVAHGSDLGAAQRVLDRLQAALAGAPEWPRPRALSRAELQALEPALQPDLKAWLLPEEGQLLPRELLQALAEQAPGVQWGWGRRVAQVQPGRIVLDDGAGVEADLAIDVRGLGARAEVG
ncbi:MAG: FAD-dependent oxidoreductase, partial [Burkholderiales bacterium]|nr:FAD-dependent oxidoreductase [Burkholderiales bacterium]